MLYDENEALFHFSVSTLLLPQGSAASPSSLYLNFTCVSFESDCRVPFTPSFAAQLITFSPRHRSSSRSPLTLSPRSDSLVTQQAIHEERQRRLALSRRAAHALEGRAGAGPVVLSQPPGESQERVALRTLLSDARASPQDPTQPFALGGFRGARGHAGAPLTRLGLPATLPVAHAAHASAAEKGALAAASAARGGTRVSAGGGRALSGPAAVGSRGGH